MSASTIITALKTMLSAASAFGSGGVATHYGVLESTSGSCAVIEYQSLNSKEETFGSYLTRNDWTFAIRVYCKDLGQAEATLERVTKTTDVMNSTIRGDRTLQGTVEQVTALRGQRELPPGGTVDAGGAIWLENPFEVDCYEYPDG